jgi:hypothetical protein
MLIIRCAANITHRRMAFPGIGPVLDPIPELGDKADGSLHLKKGIF